MDGSRASGQPAIELRRFSYRYPDAEDWAIDRMSLRIQPGEFVAVTGPNGSGKSSFCKSLNGIIPHFEGGTVRGSVRIHGLNTRSYPVAELARQVGLVLEDPDAQLFAGTVLDEAAFGPENLGMDPQHIRTSVARALRAVGLRGLDDRAPSTLSGGQKQRLAIAASLAMTPRVLVFDEATSQLDAEGSQQLMELVSRLKLRYKLTVIVATHDMALARAYADRVLALENGRVVAFDTPERVLDVLPPEPRVRRCAERPIVLGHAPAPVDRGGSSARGGAAEDAPVIRIESLRCEYPGIVAVDGADLQVPRGQFVGIVGRNGSGKTTLIRSIVGLVPPVVGEVCLGGVSARSLSPADLARRVGYVQQNPDHQLFADTVYREVAFGPANIRLGRDVIANRVTRSLSIVGLEDRALDHPLALGRHERALVALASVLALEPEVLLLDEPTRGHDLAASRGVMDIACRFCASGGTVVAIGHDLGLLCDYVDRLVVMDAGRIVADGPVGAITGEATDVLEAAGVLASHRRPPETGARAWDDERDDRQDDLYFDAI